MARIQAYASNYVPPATTSTLVSGPGAIHSILITTSAATPTTVIFYDNTIAAAPVLIAFLVNYQFPILWHSKDIGPIRFTSGLTVLSPAGCAVFVVTEE